MNAIYFEMNCSWTECSNLNGYLMRWKCFHWIIRKDQMAYVGTGGGVFRFLPPSGHGQFITPFGELLYRSWSRSKKISKQKYLAYRYLHFCIFSSLNFYQSNLDLTLLAYRADPPSGIFNGAHVCQIVCAALQVNLWFWFIWKMYSTLIDSM